MSEIDEERAERMRQQHAAEARVTALEDVVAELVRWEYRHYVSYWPQQGWICSYCGDEADIHAATDTINHYDCPIARARALLEVHP